MGLYDDRLADLSEARKRVAVRRSSRPESPRSPTSAQSLLFRRDAGWTVTRAKAWAKSHGYKYGKVDVTDQYVRLRQFDPKGSKVKRTIPFGKGIRAVIAREERQSMATRKATRRRRRRTTAKKKTAARRRPRRKARRTRRVKAAVVASKPRRRRRRAAKVTRRRRRRVREVATPIVVAAPRRRRRRRSKRRSHVHAWRGDSAGHAKAARKGHRRRKARRKTTRRRRRRVHAVATPVVATRRRRRRRKMHAVAAPKRRRRHHRRMRMFASTGGSRMTMGELATAVVFGGIGYVAADALDRFLATYNPASTTAPPKNKFTSPGGAGTLANTLNVAARPDWMRVGAGVGMVVVPIGGAMMTKRHPYARSAFEGIAVGTGIKLFGTLWNNVIMPLLTPNDTSPASLQKSVIARLYPAEVAARINMQAQQTTVGSATSGALSAPADVGPFALAADSPYPTAGQALRDATGLHDYPTVQQAYGTGEDSPYPTATQALRNATGVSEDAPWTPGPPSTPGPGPQPEGSQCGCVGDPFAGFSSFLGDSQESAGA